MVLVGNSHTLWLVVIIVVIVLLVFASVGTSLSYGLVVIMDVRYRPTFNRAIFG